MAAFCEGVHGLIGLAHFLHVNIRMFRNCFVFTKIFENTRRKHEKAQICRFWLGNTDGRFCDIDCWLLAARWGRKRHPERNSGCVRKQRQLCRCKQAGHHRCGCAEMGFAREVGDQLVFMDAGEVCESGEPHRVLDHPQQERTPAFLSSVL